MLQLKNLGHLIHLPLKCQLNRLTESSTLNTSWTHKFWLEMTVRARSIQPKFQLVRPGKVVHLKKWTRFFETFPVGPNRSIEFWTEISGNFGWMDRALRFTLPSNRVKFFCAPLRKRKKMTSSGQKVELPFVDFDPFYFCLFILLLWLWWQGFELMHIKMNSAIFAKFMFCKIEAIQEKTLAGVKVAFRQKAYK